MESWVIRATIVTASAIAASRIWSSKGGNPTRGFLAGLAPVLGLVYVIAARPLVGTDGRRIPSCTSCAELVKPDAIVCRHCGNDLPTIPCPHCTNPMSIHGTRCLGCRAPVRFDWYEGMWWARDAAGTRYMLDLNAGMWREYTGR